MCGIAGILSLSQDVAVDPDAFRAMAGQLRHRGPDDEGFHFDPRGRCGLAFRRLSIIDLCTGQQPLCNEDESVWLVFNGEIYNYRDLRRTLEALGHVFKTSSDSETIVHAYEQWGDESFARLHGMFAIALWDAPRGRLVLARDRLGKKPLTYAIASHRLYFASEAKAILAADVPRELDLAALTTYLTLQYVPAPHSIYRGFQKLLPGHFVAFEAGKPAAGTQAPFWQAPRGAPRFAGDYEQARERLGELLLNAVEKRLISDVPLGAFLSGGIDSSIVVGLMRRLRVNPLRTFSIGFADARYDERAHARMVARHFQTEHHEHVVTPQAREIIDVLAHHFDEPFADSSAIPTYYVSKYTRASVTVALTGDGGDECFAGYDRYRAVQLVQRLRNLPSVLRRTAAGAAGLLPRGRAKSLSNRAWRFLSAIDQPPDTAYLAWISVIPGGALRQGLRDDLVDAHRIGDAEAWIARLQEQSGHRDAAERAIYADVNSYLPYDLLTKVDIASMACSLECRAPFLDHELVEFAMSLPIEWRLGPGRNGGKRILKDWARDFLPPPILKRSKMGFGVPIGEWFRGELRRDLEDALFASDSLCNQLFKPAWLRGMFEDHVAEKANHEHRLWALFMLERWQRMWRPRVGF